MKNLFITFIFALVATVSFAQEVKVVSLEQTKGEFTIKELTLDEGTYVFEVKNKGVDHPIGLVVTPEGKTDQSNHIKEAYVNYTPNNGEVAQSQQVKLEKGTYVYFCPLNPTPQYKLIVK